VEMDSEIKAAGDGPDPPYGFQFVAPDEENDYDVEAAMERLERPSEFQDLDPNSKSSREETKRTEVYTESVNREIIRSNSKEITLLVDYLETVDVDSGLFKWIRKQTRKLEKEIETAFERIRVLDELSRFSEEWIEAQHQEEACVNGVFKDRESALDKPAIIGPMSNLLEWTDDVADKRARDAEKRARDLEKLRDLYSTPIF